MDPRRVFLQQPESFWSPFALQHSLEMCSAGQPITLLPGLAPPGPAQRPGTVSPCPTAGNYFFRSVNVANETIVSHRSSGPGSISVSSSYDLI